MISVSRLKIAELAVYLNDSKLAEREIIPLNRSRAISLMANPRAQSSDVVVYLAHFNDKPIGYRTILPDTITVNGNTIRVAWLSATWVHPDYRRQGVASMLLTEVINDWGANVLTNNFAPNAKLLYSKSELFGKLHAVNGMRYYLRKTNLKDYNTCTHSNLISLAGERIINLFNISAPLRKLLDVPHNVDFEYFTCIDNQLAEMFNEANQNTLTRRGKEEWSWMLRYPWLQASPLGDRITPKYFFASAPPVFNQYVLKVFFHNEIIGMLHIQHSHTRLTVPYSCFEPAHSDIIAKVVLLHAEKLKATFITTYNANLINGLNKLRPYFLYTRKRTREYLATKELVNLIGSYQFSFNDGDGDCGFI